MNYSDEILGAYIDGELGAAQKQALEDALETDTVLGARLEQLKATDRLFMSGLDALTTSDTPADILNLLVPNDANKKRVLLSDHNSKTVNRWLPLAACFLAAAFMGSGYLLGKNQTDKKPALFAQSITQTHPLFSALETTPSASRISLDEATQLSLEPLLSFNSVDGNTCRQFSVITQSSAYEALACREKNAWKLQAWATSSTIPLENYSTASGTPSPAIEAAIDDLIEGDAMSAEDESHFIRSGWK